MTKNFRNGTNTVAKHDTIFQGEEILEFFMAPTVKTHLSVLAQKINLEPKSSACFFDRFKSRTISFRSP